MTNLIETPDWVDGVYQLETTDPVVGGVPNLDLGQGFANIQAQQLASRTNWLRGRVDDLSRADKINVTVGATGDFLTINAALAELSRYRLSFGENAGVHTITLKNGYVMEEQVVMRAVDLSNIKIVSEASVVTIARDALNTDNGFGEFPAFSLIDGATCPVIGVQFEMNTAGLSAMRHGISALRAGGPIIFEDNSGIRNCGGMGAFLRVSTLRAPYGDFSNCDTGILIANLSSANLEYADVSGAATYGVDAVSLSLCLGNNMDATGCGLGGARLQKGSRASFVTANLRKGAANSSSDLTLLSGSMAACSGMLGGCNLAPNTPTVSGLFSF
ncbi:hypothetical protein SAMN05444339_10278 [Loktanella atrilutea]|uniref:Right handed beta helix region n=1 Tax=Loktanella atrilutea TaxID=366533 RepID=A0A1M4WDQ0_LOKAT|nr:hypothetical protein [Loktanella atrilutea]SHE79305.1 hypothetical protein SAMN05444339_10278 [Loktanella atrilutea]